MDDNKIIELYFERSERAIAETDKKYGSYARCVCRRVLGDVHESEECVNDTYQKLWESIPPTRPKSLLAYIGKIARNLSISRYRYKRMQKRNSVLDESLEELAAVLPSREGDVCDDITLRECINSFLAALPKRSRVMFVRRYFYSCSIREIAGGLGVSESCVKVTLMRVRDALRERLIKEEIYL